MVACVKWPHMDPADLSKNELEVLRILWERKDLKPAEIQESFSWTIENATLRSILVNLVERGHLTRRLQGKAYHYAARVPKASLLQATTRALARVFSGGSTKELLLQLVDTEDISPSEIGFIRATAAERAAKTRKKRTS
jgi:BlaI family penicillinase repressor